MTRDRFWRDIFVGLVVLVAGFTLMGTLQLAGSLQKRESTILGAGIVLGLAIMGALVLMGRHGWRGWFLFLIAFLIAFLVPLEYGWSVILYDKMW